jgi:hypothetical protein
VKTIFGYYVIKVPGTWTYKFLKSKDFEPKTIMNYKPIDVTVREYTEQEQLEDWKFLSLVRDEYAYRWDNQF